MRLGFVPPGTGGDTVKYEVARSEERCYDYVASTAKGRNPVRDDEAG